MWLHPVWVELFTFSQCWSKFNDRTASCRRHIPQPLIVIISRPLAALPSSVAPQSRISKCSFVLIKLRCHLFPRPLNTFPLLSFFLFSASWRIRFLPLVPIHFLLCLPASLPFGDTSCLNALKTKKHAHFPPVYINVDLCNSCMCSPVSVCIDYNVKGSLSLPLAGFYPPPFSFWLPSNVFYPLGGL